MSTPIWPPAHDCVVHVADCRLHCTHKPWGYATANMADIELKWRDRSRQNPRMFNGTIYMLAQNQLEDGIFSGNLFPVEFKSFLHWREHEKADPLVRDGFGCAILRSSEGHILMGRQHDGQLNSGNFVLPGGLIDGRDAAADGSVDIAAAIAREAREETGIDISAFDRQPGYYLSFSGRHLAICAAYRSCQPADRLLNDVNADLRRQSEPEFAEVRFVTGASDLEAISVPAYARALVHEILGT